MNVVILVIKASPDCPEFPARRVNEDWTDFPELLVKRSQARKDPLVSQDTQERMVCPDCQARRVKLDLRDLRASEDWTAFQVNPASRE